MGVERYEQLGRAVYDAFNKGDEAMIDELFADGYVEHADLPPGATADREGVKTWLRMMRGGFPDLQFEVLDMIMVEGKACARARMTGTNTGEVQGMPATGKAIDVEALDLVRIGDDDRIVEHWGSFEEGKMMRQLGLLPE